MAQPPAYNRNKDFTEDFGNETDHSALNAELDRASNSINDIRTNLAILQADDGKLRPSVVTADSISPELRVSLVEGVVLDAQAMLDRSLAAADASASAAQIANTSANEASLSAVSAAESARIAALAINADWNATEGAAEILNKPELSAVALSGNYADLLGIPQLSAVALSGSYSDLANAPANLATDDDIDLLQTSKANKTQVANLAMPSNSYTQLTLPTNPSSFTAPADGYFFSTAYAGTSAGFINFSNTNGMGNMAGVSAGNAVKIFLPVKKGDIVGVNYGNLTGQTTVGFFYCEGSQP